MVDAEGIVYASIAATKLGHVETMKCFKLVRRPPTQSIDLVKNGYDSCVVIAHTEQGARNIHPSGDNKRWGSRSWVSPEDLHHVKVTELGYFVLFIRRS